MLFVKTFSQHFFISIVYFRVSHNILMIFLTLGFYYAYNMYKKIESVSTVMTFLQKQSETAILWCSLKCRCALKLCPNEKMLINYRIFFCKPNRTFYYHRLDIRLSKFAILVQFFRAGLNVFSCFPA